jgi:hypothetical protein
MRPDEFFIDDEIPDLSGNVRRHVDTQLLATIRTTAADGRDDIEVALPLAVLIHEDLEKYGTASNQEMSEADMRLAILALRAVLQRLGITGPEIPFRDFGSFRTYWGRNDGYGSWQARRTMLRDIFDPLHDQLAVLEQRSLTATLADPVSMHKRTGWPGVDTEISELRRHFQGARTGQDYRNVGLDCVAVTESLSAEVYDPAKHLRDGEEEPPVANTKQRLERFVEDTVPGPENATLRKLARSTIEYAQHVKHSGTPTRREAGIAADAVIQLANILRRLDDDGGGWATLTDTATTEGLLIGGRATSDALNGLEDEIEKLETFLNGADNSQERFNTIAITGVQARMRGHLANLVGVDLPWCTQLAEVDQPWARADRLAQEIGNARLEIQRARG